MNTYPARPCSSTYNESVVERPEEFVGPNARCNPSRELPLIVDQSQVWTGGVWIDDGEVLGLVVNRRGGRAFWHSCNASRRAPSHPSYGEDEKGAGGWREQPNGLGGEVGGQPIIVVHVIESGKQGGYARIVAAVMIQSRVLQGFGCILMN